MWKNMIEDRDFDKILDEGRKSYADFFYKTSEDNATAIAEGAPLLGKTLVITSR